MKRIFNILILLMINYLSIYADVKKNLVFTLGEMYVLNPVADSGMSGGANGLAQYSSSNNYNGEYTLSDPTAFSITPIKKSYNYYGTHYYNNYQITPLKEGTYNFSQYIYDSSNMSSTTVIYSITVVSVKSIYLPTSLSLDLGENYLFAPVIVDSRAKTSLTWTSSAPEIVQVDGNGNISAIALGTSIITCINSNGVSAQCEVTVNPVLVSGISLNETEAELTVGEKLQMEATIAPDNATDKTLTWSSTNEAVAVVSESGLVTAVGSGTCQVKATANDGSGKSASCLITVEKNNKLTVTNMTQCSGGRGVLNVLLTDEEIIMGFQFDLQLPTGVTVAENEGKLLAQLTGNAVNTHSISSTKVSDGLYRFVVTPQGSRAISQAIGDGMTITIDVADEVAVGTYPMTISDIEMTVKKTGNVYEDIHPKNSTATLTVTEAVMGDVNGDGRVSVTDVISMNSYILEEEPAQFIRKVADLNGDGRVTITDMVQVIDIILGR